MTSRRKQSYWRWHHREAAHTAEHELPIHDPTLCPHDEAIFLLHTGAEVEHALMVQYLYAAYSLKDPHEVPEEHRGEVRRWRGALLGIAREEMGHLVTVQNLLRLIGGPINLEREDYPFRSGLYPFHFRLEPLSKGSLAKYVVAEMPLIEEPTEEVREVLDRATSAATAPVNRVGALYQRIGHILSVPPIADRADLHLAHSDFHSEASEWQAHRADWGGSDSLLIPEIGSREEALAAIEELAEQGEGLFESSATPSHYQRFLSIYREFPEEGEWEPTYAVPVDPNTSRPAHLHEHEPHADFDEGRITHPFSRLWAQLFNLRYRLLLGYLSHFLESDGPLLEADGNYTPRGYLQKWTFDEMRHVGRIAGKLATLPRWAGEDERPERAGAPFELPYTVHLSSREADRWRHHFDALSAAISLAQQLERTDWHHDHAGDEFLHDLLHADHHTRDLARAMLEHGKLPPQPTNFHKVVQMLDDSVRGFRVGAHHNFWRGCTRDEFVSKSIFGLPLIARTEDGLFDPVSSNLLKALRGDPPFDEEREHQAGEAGGGDHRFPRMPAHHPPMRPEWLDYIRRWIEEGCPDSEPVGRVGIEGEASPTTGTR